MLLLLLYQLRAFLVWVAGGGFWFLFAGSAHLHTQQVQNVGVVGPRLLRRLEHFQFW